MCSGTRFRFLPLPLLLVLRPRRRKSGKNRRAFEQPRPFVVDSNWPTPRKLIRWNFARDRLFSYRFGAGRRTQAGTASAPSQHRTPTISKIQQFRSGSICYSRQFSDRFLAIDRYIVGGVFSPKGNVSPVTPLGRRTFDVSNTTVIKLSRYCFSNRVL